MHVAQTFHKASFLYLQMAAAVLDVGRFVQSPKPNILGYVTCCNVCLSTARYPVLSTIGVLEFFRMSGADMGGVTWRKSYYARRNKAE